MVHYWLVAMRGGEKVLEALLELFPQADIYTHVYTPEAVSPSIRKHTVNTSFIQKLPFARRHYQKYVPLMPLALEQLDLRDYDLVISSESGPAKGVLTSADSLHICYCHTPMRYLWDFYQDYLTEAGPLLRPLWRLVSHRLRQWDALSSLRVDHFVANSHNVAKRIAKHYRRQARVIHPPVDIEAFAPRDGFFPDPEDFYLFVGQLNAYKRADLAVEACTHLNRRLTVVGDGPERGRLEKLAGPSVSFLGRLPAAEVADLMRRCRALLFPGEEDFGIVPVEALASGRPVIAYGRGGVLESVRHASSGWLFASQDVSSLSSAMEAFEAEASFFDPSSLISQARRFSKKTFQNSFLTFLHDCRPEADFRPPVFLAADGCEIPKPVQADAALPKPDRITATGAD
jgi:glycosyltransferase involved in cell wall biosynthesis